MGLKSKRKGQSVEREAVNILKEIGFPDARRSVQYNGNAGDADIICPDSLPGIFVECKSNKQKCVIGSDFLAEALALAKEQAATVGQTAVVLWKEHGKGWRLMAEVNVGGMMTTATFTGSAETAQVLRTLQAHAESAAKSA